MKVIIDIDPELFNNVVKRTQEGRCMSDVWLAVGHGTPYEERPQGDWVPNDKISPWGNPGRSCSLCGKIVEFSENFCPKCGAKMITRSDL